MTPCTLVCLFAVVVSVVGDDEGPKQDRYEIAYHHVLRNRTKEPQRDVRVYLTVPPNDAYQAIEDFRVETFGNNVHISNRHDEYGNALKRVAILEIKPGEEVRVGFSCKVVLRPPPVARLGRKSKKSYADVDKGLIDHYTRDHGIFGLGTPVIKAMAAKLLREYPDPAERATAIHHLITGTFKYKSEGGWDAAPVVLKRRSGSCSEFTHVFCALCRATGIPTRMVGASIMPAKRRPPFTDRGWHRWPEAYLPDQGWVSFDPTLDRGRKKPLFVGTHHARTLILTRKGDRSTQLGLSYIPSNSHGRQMHRSRYFVWSQKTRARLDKAKELLEAGDRKKAVKRLKRLVKRYAETRAGIEAARMLKELGETGV